MSRSWTLSNRFLKMALGESRTTWGTLGVDLVLDLFDAAADGQVAASGVLSTVLGMPDLARSRVLFLHGPTIVPNTPKWYLAVNDSGTPQTLATASGRAATVPDGTLVPVVCDGRDCLTFASPGANTGVLIPSAADAVLDLSCWGKRVFVVAPGTLTLPPPLAGVWLDVCNKSGSVVVVASTATPIMPPAPLVAVLTDERGTPIVTETGIEIATLDLYPDTLAMQVRDGQSFRLAYSSALNKWVGVG